MSDNLRDRVAQEIEFWLVDGDEDSQWERCKDQVRKRWHISYVTTVQIPSGDMLRLREAEERFAAVLNIWSRIILI